MACDAFADQVAIGGAPFDAADVSRTRTEDRTRAGGKTCVDDWTHADRNSVCIDAAVTSFPLMGCTVHVLDIRTISDADCALLAAVLPARHEAAQRFTHRADYLRSVGAGLLLLARLGLRDEAGLARGPQGKPFAEGFPAFNLSHSGNFAVLAVADVRVGAAADAGAVAGDACAGMAASTAVSSDAAIGAERATPAAFGSCFAGAGAAAALALPPILAFDPCSVGADIELLRERNLSVAKRVFTPEERAWMSHDPLWRFHVLWTQKESVMKLFGLGFCLPPESFDVSAAQRGTCICVRGRRLAVQTCCWDGAAISVARFVGHEMPDVD